MVLNKSLFILIVGIFCFSISSSVADDDDVNVVELSYAEAAASDVEGATEDQPSTTTESYLPEHPKLNPSDKFSVPPATGKDIKIGNLTVYESLYKNSSKLMLITVYDIFGFHPHVKYIADKLAESGFLVVIPDFLHGNPVPIENFPQPNFTERATHLFNKNGSWVDIKPDILEVIRHYKMENGITAIGVYSYCWGGKITVYAASDPEFSNDIKAIGLVHPSRVTTEDASDLKVPAILLPSSSEPDMIPFLNIVNKNLGNNQSVHYRFENMAHGFAGARSDFSNSTIRKSVDEVILRLSNFFTTSLKSI